MNTNPYLLKRLKVVGGEGVGSTGSPAHWGGAIGKISHHHLCNNHLSPHHWQGQLTWVSQEGRGRLGQEQGGLSASSAPGGEGRAAPDTPPGRVWPPLWLLETVPCIPVRGLLPQISLYNIL